MPTPFLIFASLVILGFILLWLFAPRAIVRVVTAILLFTVFLFCIYGFMASYELSNGRLPWQIGYGVIGLLCLTGATMFILNREKH